MNPSVIPPLDIRLKIGPFNDSQSYLDWGKLECQRLIEMCGMSPNDRVFDMGCGCGRVAIHIGEYLKEGSYIGMDNYLSLIRWCKMNIEPHYTNLQFHYINIYSGQYNPQGSLQASSLALPIPDDYFTLVFTSSLFTHMFLEDVEGYMKEFSRILSRGSQFYSTFFLLKNDGTHNRTNGESIFEDHKVPERRVSHPEDKVLTILMRNGFAISQIVYGNWRTSLPAYPVPYQDIIVATKK